MSHADKLLLPKAKRFPFPDALLDLDFQKQRYFWAGQYRGTSAFNSFSLNSAVLDRRGLVVGASVDITILTASFGFSFPFSIIARFIATANPGATVRLLELHDGTANERITVTQATNGAHSLLGTDGGAGQWNFGGAAGTPPLNTLAAIGMRCETNSVLGSRNGLSIGLDTSATMPTPDRLHIGRGQAGSTEYSGIIQRILIPNYYVGAAGLTALTSALMQ